MTGNSVLIVEDDALIALQHEAHVKALGYTVVTASQLKEALEQVARHDLIAAIVDYRLHQETAEPLMNELQIINIPFAIVTAYPTAILADIFEGFPIITKPCQQIDFECILNRLCSNPD